MEADEGDLYEGSRVCVECNERKHITEFHLTNNKRGKANGRRRKCKSCVTLIAKKYRNANRDRYRELSRKWHLKSQYGLSVVDYDQMLTEQEEKCKVCKIKFDLEDQNRRPHVDHCHNTGKVRGILCFTCNTAIGKMKDDPDLLRKAADYLEDD